MAETSKFDRLFENAAPRGAPRADAPEKRPDRQRAEKAVLGRPPGKRSDPAWKQFSILLKRETHRKAADFLRAKDEGQDLSGLVQTLLERWIKQQRS